MANDRQMRIAIEIETSSPFYLHPSENPALALVDPPLEGRNFHSWSRAMRMALVMKNKLGFVNGTIPKPVDDERMMNRWEQCDATVMAWITKSVSPAIKRSIIWMNSSKDIWDDLH